MEYKEYLEKVAKLQIEFDLAKQKLMHEFVDANNPHKVGDIIEDHIGKVEIVQIGYSWGWSPEIPCATYNGFEITKKGVRNKLNKTRVVYQSNLIN